MFGSKKKYSKSKINAWSDKGDIERLMHALEKGNDDTKIFAIDALVVHNFMNVKRTLTAALEDTNKDVALRAVKAIEHMGANQDEIEKIKEIRAKWKVQKDNMNSSSESEKNVQSGSPVSSKRKKPFVIKESPLEKLKPEE
jgi:hypothetical protein